ncbi:MAG TPA: carboxypeptidase-like regulatory domain-containing protein [Cyclobacteriaceae bacterium]|nr:carboxypeptidase-like regulatory domain-containing protein [Cyclobacteriaceae bacterium]
MKSSFSLSVPEPCSRKWENFVPKGNGGFCSSCSKVVVDFTKMSDAELIRYFSKRPSNTCGRFRPDQLNSYFEITRPRVKPGFALLKASILCLILIFFNRPSSNAYASNDLPAVANIMPKPAAHRVSGTVVSKEDGQPMPGVNVVLKGHVVGTTTDADGRFAFPNDLRKGDVLIFSFIGMVTVEYVVNDEENIRVELGMDTYVLGSVEREFVGVLGLVSQNELFTISPSRSYAVKGIVIASEDNTPLPGVNVVLKYSHIGTVTDQNGEFTFPKELEDGDILVFSFIGFNNTEYEVKRTDNAIIEIKLGVWDVMGEVDVTGLYSPRNRFITWLQRLF